MSKYFFTYSNLPKLSVANDKFDVRFIHTANISVAFNVLKAGAEVPKHEHVHETIDYIQEGELDMTIGDEKLRMYAGMVARVPSHVLHSAKAITDCKVINVFYPKRDDFGEM
jgi:quercetin dioxygenase-like cupin family protein